MSTERLVRTASVAGLAAAAVLVAVLAQQKREVLEENADLRLRAATPHVGLQLPPLPAVTLDGDSVVLGAPLAGRRQLLFFLNTTCPFCEATVPMWIEVASRVAGSDGTRTDVYAVSLDDAELMTAFVMRHRFGIPSVVLDDRRFVRLFRANFVPLTIVVGDDGRVRHAHVGVIDSAEVMDGIVAAATRDRALATAPDPP
jgi:thiol-disulfide isomerase/thioredoxin